jgi:16S rRNA (guanine966-N2)-methyltransferase
MRVIAGSAKGTRLGPVPSGTRPVSDRAREGLFSSLGPAIEGARVLDLFAGTGALGIEALSRGAESATFVEAAGPAVKVIRLNLARTHLEGLGRVRHQTALGAVRAGVGPFDLVFLDPPYRIPGPELDALIAEVAGQGVVVPSGRVVLTRLDRSYTPVIPVHWQLERRLSYGDTAVLVFLAG